MLRDSAGDLRCAKVPLLLAYPLRGSPEHHASLTTTFFFFFFFSSSIHLSTSCVPRVDFLEQLLFIVGCCGIERVIAR
jgi:hypothetical protein